MLLQLTLAALEVDFGKMGRGLEMWTLLPFAAMLLAIAVMPLLAPKFWEHNSNKAWIAALLAAPVTVHLLGFGDAGAHALLEKAQEYLSFMAMLGALYVITGGIVIEGSLSGTPLLNTALLGIGAVVSNFIGTTGASVLLIRPMLRANERRVNTTHIFVFFIFVVSNCGGLLTPMGDPPLFLGFLKGVPFLWTFSLWKPWLLVNGVLLILFNMWDQAVFDREELERPGSQLEEVQRHAPLKILGLVNVPLLMGVILVIYLRGMGAANAHRGLDWPFGLQEFLLAFLAVASYGLTPKNYHDRNKFSFSPIIEVAVVFAGIFITMAPALLILNSWGEGDRQVFGMNCGLAKPWHFFWATGCLSSFLDNAPTYLTFAATACGLKDIPLQGAYLLHFLSMRDPIAVRLLQAISCGSVMMGANTYIGNGPNFMVKAIVEQHGVKMPSFFEYMAYSGVVLIPLFVVVTLFFFL